MTSESGDGEGSAGSFGRRVLTVVAAVVALAAVAWGVSVLGADDPEPAPAAPADEPAEPEREEPAEPEEPEEPRETDDAPQAEAFDRLMERVTGEVAAIRGLEAEEAIEAEVQDTDELAGTIAAIVERDRDPDELETQRRILVTLRLLPADLDLEATLEALLAEQVAGLYSPEDGILYVRSDDPGDLTPGEHVTLAHEVAHALQDQVFGLERFLELPDEEADARLAAQSLVEGDAVLTQELWSLQHQSEEEREARIGELAEVDTQVLEEAPRYLRESLVFPYQEGLAFVQTLHEGGGFDAVDAAFEDPPTTTAQILAPQRYLDGDEPAHVDIAASPGTDWTVLGEYTVGAFDLRSLVREVDPDAAGRLAAGWAGGRLGAWERDDEVAISVTLAFRGGDDAAVACDVLADWYATVADGSRAGDTGVFAGDRDWAAVDCADEEVRLGIGPSEDTAQTLAGG